MAMLSGWHKAAAIPLTFVANLRSLKVAHRRHGISSPSIERASIRRKFTDVFQSQGSVIAEEAIKRIAGL